MSFNIIDMLILAILALSLVSGMYKGFIASGLTAVGCAAAFFGSMQLYPQLANTIQSNSSLMSTLLYYVDASAMFPSPAIADLSIAQVVADSGNTLLNSALDGLNLPSAIERVFASNVTGQVFAGLENVTTLGDYLGQTVLGAAINVLSFLVVFAVAYIVVLLLVNLLNNLFRFPLLRHLDWLLGGVFGLARGYFVLMLLLAVLPMVLSVVNLQVVNDIVAQSQYMAYFPQNFAIPEIIQSAFKMVTG